MVSIMKFLIVGIAAAFFAVAAPCSAMAADTEPAAQDAATGGAITQPEDTQKTPAVPKDVCSAPQKYCLSDAELDRLNRAVFLPRNPSDTPPSTSARDNLSQPYPSDRSYRDMAQEEQQWRTNAANRVDQFLDDHLGGFGKMEVDRPGYKMRFEYIYTRRCKVKGVGVCMSINF